MQMVFGFMFSIGLLLVAALGVFIGVAGVAYDAGFFLLVFPVGLALIILGSAASYLADDWYQRRNIC